MSHACPEMSKACLNNVNSTNFKLYSQDVIKARNDIHILAHMTLNITYVSGNGGCNG